MLESLKETVFLANLALRDHGLILFTWGNVSALDRETGLVVIKPSGVEYSAMKPEDMVVVDLAGNQVEGVLRPSSDTPTHLVLYKQFGNIGGIVHTHSTWATIRAQARLGVPAYGTTHADYFYGEIPCTREMSPLEIAGAYEENTGLMITEVFRERKISPMQVPAVLVSSHGPFAWGRDAGEAVHNAVVLEQTAHMAHETEMAHAARFPGEMPQPVSQELLDRHFLRKHGPGAYYGQTAGKKGINP
jgi:L-ribulose-5-phosphate 4-epimerase